MTSNFARAIAPSLILVLAWLAVMRAARRSAWQVAVISLPGTILHEAMHFICGALLLARPVSVSLIPRRLGNGWQLGSVSFANLNLLNAAPVAFAPLLLLGIAWLEFEWWMRPSLAAGKYATWIAGGYLVACSLFSCLPSTTDLRVGAWSAALWITAGCAAWRFLL